MGTIASLNVDLGMTSVAFAKGIESSRRDLRKFGSEVTSQSRGVAANIKSFASGGDEAAAVKSIGKLLKGGGAVMGFRLIADDAERFRAKLEEIHNELGKTISGFQAFRSVAEGVPIFGQAARAGFSIGDLIRDASSNMAGFLGFSKEVQDSLLSATTSAERMAKAIAESRAEAAAMVSVNRRIDLFNLKSSAVGAKGTGAIKAQFQEEMMGVRAEAQKLADEMNQEGGPWSRVSAGMKQGIVNALYSAGAGLANNKAKQAMMDRQREAADVITSGQQRIADIKAGIEQQSAQATGSRYAQEMAAAKASYMQQAIAVQTWADKQKHEYPEIARQIDKVKDSTMQLLAQQLHLAETTPLAEAMANLKNEMIDVGAAYRTANPEIEMQIQKLKEMHATIEQLVKARQQLQYIEDAKNSKGVREGIQTPLETLLKKKEELQRMLAAEMIDKDQFGRALGDAAQEARDKLGITSAGKAAPLVERRVSTFMPGQQTVLDPINSLVGEAKATKVVAQQQLQIMRDQQSKGIAVFSIK